MGAKRKNCLEPQGWDTGTRIILRVPFTIPAKANSKSSYVVFGCGEFDGNAFFFSRKDGAAGD